MNKKMIKSVILSTSCALMVSAVLPGFANGKASASTIEETKNVVEHDYDLFDVYSPTFQQDLIASKLMISTQGEEVGTQGALKALKLIGSTIKNGGHALSWLIAPFSKATADAVKRNAAKIGKALAAPAKATSSYIENRLIQFGVKKDDAQLITKMIMVLL